MENWSEDFVEMLDTIAKEVEHFFADVAKDIDAAIDALVDVSEEFAEQMHTAFASDFEEQISGFIDPILEAVLGLEGAVEEASQPIIHTVDPILNHHTACVGCRHYHGQVYGGTPLVCGMHPYGWEDEQCPDWQSVWQE